MQPPEGNYQPPSQPPYSQQPTQPPYQQPYNQPQGAVPPPPYNYGQYPPQQPYYAPQPPPKKRSNGWLWALGVIVLALFICVAAGTHGSSSPSTTTTTSSSNTTDNNITTQKQNNNTTKPDASAAHHKVGETVSVDNTWDITVNGIATSQGDTYTQPKAGNTYLLVTVTFKNISGKQQTMSSLLGFTVRGPDGQTYDQSAFGNDKALPDGDVAAGALTKGQISYEVPASVKQFTLSYSDFLGQVQTWDISD